MPLFAPRGTLEAAMAEAEIAGILADLDEAHEDLKSARTRLAELLPMSATRPGDSGQARVEFVTGLEPETGEADGAERIRQINAEAWEIAQQALINAHEKVELAHKALKSQLGGKL
jgi:hypothetical protein